MATPVTAGAVALLIEEYRDMHNGETPRPDLVKSILASAATDLDYDSFTQGSGRVDAYYAVAGAGEGKDPHFPHRFYLESNATWDSVQGLIENSWELNMGKPLLEQPMGSANWFAGIISPGNSASATFSLNNAVNPKAQSFQFQLIGTQSFQNSTTGNVTWITLPKAGVPAGTDLMKVTLLYHFSDFANSSLDVKDELIAQLYDVGSDGSLRRINNGAPEGTTSELTVSKPFDKFAGVPRVRILLQTTGGPSKIPFELVVRYYGRVSWNWVTNLEINGSTLAASLSVPNSTLPGVYEGLIAVKDQYSQSMIPVSVVVPIVAPGSYHGASSTPYDNYDVFGAFDWSWRYETGDWRTFALVVPEGVRKVSLGVKWSDNGTDIQAHLTGPLGYIVASSEYPTSKYLGNGEFYWSTTTGGPEEVISAENLTPGTYLFVLHNTLFGADSFAVYPEVFTIDVNFM